jgi:N-acyl-L-homoserine lactone synthetase
MIGMTRLAFVSYSAKRGDAAMIEADARQVERMLARAGPPTVRLRPEKSSDG